MKSLAILNGSRKNDGITRGSILFYNAMKDQNRNVKWHQLQDTPNISELPPSDQIYKGITFPGYTISNGLNRLLILRKKVSAINEDFIFLSDPTLVSFFDSFSNILVKFNDFRAFSPYNDKKLTKMMYSHLLPKLKKVQNGMFATEYVAKEAEQHGILLEHKFIIPEPMEKPHSLEVKMKESIERVEKGAVTFTYIATDRPYKNVDFFLKLSSTFSSIQQFKFILVCNTRQNRTEYIRKNFQNVTLIQGAKSMDEIYRTTDILLFPSLYEGFGRPVVEAMSYGIPVIASDIDPLREISNGSSELVAPNSLEAWIESIQKVLAPEKYKKIASESARRFQFFSPEKFSERVKSMMDIFL